jgi:hypothetical protein
MLVEAFS